MLNPREIAKIRKMREEGVSYGRIAKKIGCSKPTVKKYCANMIAEKEKKSTTAETSPTPQQEELVEGSSEAMPEQDPIVVSPSPTKEYFITETSNPQILKSVEHPEDITVEVRGVPVGKKIQFTPKNLTMWEWFKSTYHGWENSDISDFINQCMDYYFKKGLGAKMKIEVVQEYV